MSQDCNNSPMPEPDKGMACHGSLEQWNAEVKFSQVTTSKRSKNIRFSVAHGLGSFLRKVIFLPLVDPVDPFGHPPVCAELAACRSLVGLGIGV